MIKEIVKHDIQRSFSIFRVLGILFIIGYLLYSGYVTLVQPHTKNRIASTNQKAERITNYNIYREDTRFIGLKAGWFKVGIDIPKGDKKE